MTRARVYSGRVSFRLALVAVLAALAAGAPPAAGAVRTLHVDDPLDAQDPTPSLQPRPLAPDITAVDATYDEAGSISLAVTFANEHDQPPSVDVVFGCAGTPVTTAIIYRERSFSGPEDGPSSWDDQGSATLDGFDGAVYSTVNEPEGSRTMRASFAHEQFAGRQYRCVRARWDDSDFAGARDDTAAGWFAGFEPMRLDAATALATARLALAGRFGPGYGATLRYLACPSVAIAQAIDDPTAPDEVPTGAAGGCEYFMRAGDRITLGGLLVRADDQQRRWTTTSPSAVRYRRAWRRCPAPRFVTSLKANQPCGGPRLLAGDIEARASRRFPRPLQRRFKVYSHGTNTAGFGALYVYRCRARHRFITRDQQPVRRTRVGCANRMGERFRLVLHMA